MTNLIYTYQVIVAIVVGFMISKELIKNKYNLRTKAYWIEKSKCVRCQAFWTVLIVTCDIKTALTVVSFLLIWEFMHRDEPTKLN